VFLSKKLGLWIFITYAWTVATGFFLFFPYRVANSVRFYRILFPKEMGFIIYGALGGSFIILQTFS
jgi:hypothetical protein